MNSQAPSEQPAGIEEEETLAEKPWPVGRWVFLCGCLLLLAAYLNSVPLFVFAIVHFDNAAVRDISQKALGRIGAPAVPSLVDVFADRTLDEDCRLRALGALWHCRFGEENGWKVITPPSPAPFIDALRDRSADIRHNAASYLRNFPEHASVAVPALIDAMNEDEHVRMDAVEAIVEMLDAAIPPLLESLKSQNVTTRSWAANCLGDMAFCSKGENLQASVRTALLEFLRDKDTNVRSLVTQLCDDPDGDVRAGAARAIGQLSGKGELEEQLR